jgi:hypothetical protein
VWHVSRGIVFAGGSNATYRPLPAVRHNSAPAVAAAVSEGSSAALPAILTTTDVSGELSAGQGPGAMLDGVTAVAKATRITTTTTTTTTATTPTTAAVEGGATGQNESAATDTAEKPKQKDAADVVVPFTPLDYKIPYQIFHEAKKAPEGTPGSFWSYDMYRGPGENGALDSKVKVHYCTSALTMERVIKQYFMDEKVIGLDLEWMIGANKFSSARQNISLIQIASPTRVGLFHLAAFPKNSTLVTPALKELLQNPAITKAGVWIKGDCTRLSNFLQIETRGQFELSHLYRLVKYSETGEYALINKKLVSLSTQVEEYLGLPMYKGDDVRTSDWSINAPLSMKQIACKPSPVPAEAVANEQIADSSSDAYAAVQLYAILNHHRQKLVPVPDVPHHAELNLPIPVIKPVVPKVAKGEKADTDTVVEDKPVLEVQTAVEAKIALDSAPVVDQTSVVSKPAPNPKATKRKTSIAKAKLDVKSSVQLSTTPPLDVTSKTQQALENTNSS